jgi:peptidoglycan/LPS O-acetylase OafA/YrhL
VSSPDRVSLRDWVGLDAENRAAFTAFTERKYFASLDGLRALSILAVVWHHTGARAFPYDSPLRSGAYGVSLFFCISGFLITTLLLREKQRRGDVSLRAFYARRALRIFPLYYAMLLAYTALVLVMEGTSEEGSEFFGNLPYFATYTSNYFVQDSSGTIFYFVWSLAAEEQFYLVWPLVEKRLRKGLAVALLVALIAITVAQRELLSGIAGPFHEEGSFNFVVSRLATPIFLGVLIAHALSSPAVFGVLHRVFGRAWSAPCALVGVLLALWGSETPMSVVHSSFALLVLACVVRADHGLAFWLDGAPLRHLGAVSYGVYLMHMLCANGVRRILGAFDLESWLLSFGITLALAWALATLSHRTFEAWFLRHKVRFSR